MCDSVPYPVDQVVAGVQERQRPNVETSVARSSVSRGSACGSSPRAATNVETSVARSVTGAGAGPGDGHGE